MVRDERRGLNRLRFHVERLENRLALAAPGSLDLSFGGTGSVVTDIGTIHDVGASVAIQSDGKIVVAGFAETGLSGNLDFAVVRYHSDGSLDTTFDGDGKVTTEFATAPSVAHSVAIQSDGKIVLAGRAGLDFALARYNPDGSLDADFDGDGRVMTDMGASDDLAYSLVIQSDGKLVVAGQSNDRFALARYNSDGSLDTAFDGDGRVTTDFEFDIDYARSVTLQADGKIVAAGVTATSNTGDFALARYHSNGSLDTTFGGDGKVTTEFGGDFGSSLDSGNSVSVQPDGKIIVAGSSYPRFSSDFALARYNPDGSLDTTFDGDGKVRTNFNGGDDFARSLVLQPDGKVVVAGSATIGFGDDVATVRYNVDGSLDTNFDGDGKVTTPIPVTPSGDDFGAAVALQSDGKIIVAGSTFVNGLGNLFATIRYHGDTAPHVASVAVPTGANGEREITLYGVDADPDDQAAGFSFLIDWDGNGSTDETVVGLSGIEVSHTFVTSANVIVIARDQYGIESMPTKFAVNPSQEAAIWTGTNGSDYVVFLQTGPSLVQIHTLALAGMPVGQQMTATGISKVIASGRAGRDTIDAGYLFSLPAEIYAGAGNDFVRGGSLADLLMGDEHGLSLAQLGSDTVYGGLGADTIYGDADGGEGKPDLIYGDSGLNDSNGGNDTIYGDGSVGHRLAVDTVYGEGGNDTIYGDASGAEGSGDVLFGGEGNDLIDTGGGNDQAFGAGGNDILLGSDGAEGANDTLDGGDGRDILVGDGGFADAENDTGGGDILNGGTGKDIVIAGSVLPSSANPVDWFAIQAEWTSGRSFAERRANITGPGSPSRANGDNYLTPGTTVYNDKPATGSAALVDQVIGGDDEDWIFSDVPEDEEVDLQVADILVDLSLFPRPE